MPTPINQDKTPDFKPIIGSSTILGQNLTKGSIVVYESTVYPGVTEDECIPVVERVSGLKFNVDFFAGYSPERINPGDKLHTVEHIKKVTSGSTPEIGRKVNEIYASVITAGTHMAPSMKVAEAAKVIENSQRDINIAFVNELSKIFTRMGIDTQDVLEAASTKWNFLPFRPGLVGGHCIGVDPYYLTFKAEGMGFHPEVILAGRRTNDGMGKYVAECTVKHLIARGNVIRGARVGILGFTFKENVPDLRNTRVVDIIAELHDYGVETLVHDAEADPAEAMHEYGQELLPLEALRDLDAVILAVSHRAYAAFSPEDIRARFRDPGKGALMDVKSLYDPAAMRAAGLDYWRL